MKQPKNKLFYTFIFSLLLVTGIFLLPKIAYLAGVDAKQIIALTNNERQQAGIKPLNASPLLALALAAENKAQAIVRSQLFQHNFPTKKFSNWIAETGYSYRYVGENLALNFLTNEGIINAWLNSPPHLNNLLNKNFSEIGVAVQRGNWQGRASTLVVQIFGTPTNNFTFNIQAIDNRLALGQSTNITTNSSAPPLATNEYYGANLFTNHNLVLLTTAGNQLSALEKDFYYDNNSNIFVGSALAMVLLSFAGFYLFALANKQLFKRKNKILLAPLK